MYAWCGDFCQGFVDHICKIPHLSHTLSEGSCMSQIRGFISLVFCMISIEPIYRNKGNRANQLKETLNCKEDSNEKAFHRVRALS